MGTSREAIKENEFLEDAVKEVALRFNLPVITSQRLRNKIGGVDVLEEVLGAHGPPEYLDLVSCRERIPKQQAERFDKLTEGLKKWVAETTEGIHVFNESDIDEYRRKTGTITQWRSIDTTHYAVVLKSKVDVEDCGSEDRGSVRAGELGIFREKSYEKRERVEYELKRFDSVWQGLERERWQVENQLVDIYRDFLDQEPEQSQTKKSVVIRLKEAFPYLRVASDLVARTADCSTGYAKQFKYVDGEGVADSEASSKLKGDALERDENTCVSCGSTENLSVHHIVPRNQGGPNELENLATLCDVCHYRAHGGRRTKADEGSQPADYSTVEYSSVDEFWSTWINQ